MTVADSLVSAVVMMEAALISGFIFTKLVRFLLPRSRRRVSVTICENGHRCNSCEDGRKIDFLREELIAEEFSAVCYHPCNVCPPQTCEHLCPKCHLDVADAPSQRET